MTYHANSLSPRKAKVFTENTRTSEDGRDVFVWAQVQTADGQLWGHGSWYPYEAFSNPESDADE